MREREFWELVDEVFGHGYGRSLVQDQHLDALAGLTAAQALSAGEQPRVVWNVLCDHMDVPDPQRWGSDHNAPPMPVRLRDTRDGRYRTGVRLLGYSYPQCTMI